MFMEDNTNDEVQTQDVAEKTSKEEAQVTTSKKKKDSKQDLFIQMRKELESRNLERKEEIKYGICCILCGEHALFLGLPGTAKSKLATDIFDCFNGATETFYTLITKHSLPEEIFGPMRISELKNDKFARKTEGYLPKANFAFLDEVFKGNSSILNGLLSILNEKIFKNDEKKENCPLCTCIGASNELPQGENLNALWDRFLVRFWVKSLTKRGFTKMLSNSSKLQQPIQPFITLQDLAEAKKEVMSVSYSKNAEEVILNAKSKLEEAGFILSDRRWVKIVNLMKAHAWVEGRTEIIQDDICVVKHCAWTRPQEYKKVNGIIRKIENPIKDDIQQLMDTAELTIQDIYNKKKEMGEEEFERSSTTEVVNANKRLKKVITDLKKIKDGLKDNPSLIEFVEEAISTVTAKNTEMTTDLLKL